MSACYDDFRICPFYFAMTCTAKANHGKSSGVLSFFYYVDITCVQKRPFVNKRLRKQAARCCKICGESKYELLDVHRIKPGSNYTYYGTVVLCSSCHRSHHSGLITIHGWNSSTAGRLLNWTDEYGCEHFS